MIGPGGVASLASINAGALLASVAGDATLPSTLLRTLPVRGLLLLALALALAYVWYVEGRGRWRSVAAEQLCYGVPWGTAVTLAIVLGFYLFVQGGAWHWAEPLVLPFATWSYVYPFGLATAGVAHASPEHLLGNVATALVLAPIAEFAWSHYPSPVSPTRSGTTASSGSTNDGSNDRTAIGPTEGVLARPWVRALVLFPTGVLAVTVLTSVFSAGSSLGFSGAVFALAGFAVVTYPVAAMVGVLAASALRTLAGALTEPVVRGSIETGPPAPPSWATVAVQSHYLGFLLGVLAGVAVVRYTSRRPVPARVFLATLLFGTVHRLWLVVFADGQEGYVLYRGVGVVLFLLVTVLVTAAVGQRSSLRSGSGASSGRAVRRVANVARAASRGLDGERPAADASRGDGPSGDGSSGDPSSGDASGGDAARRTAVALLVVAALVVALPAPFVGAVVVDDAAAPRDGAVTTGGYSVTYAENASPGQRSLLAPSGDRDPTAGHQSGVIVANPDRELWTVDVRQRVLEHDGTATVTVGGVGWRETLYVERPAWDVVGGPEVYAVDVVRDGDRTRAFHSEPATARARIDGRTVAVRPTAEGFAVSVRADGRPRASTPLPPSNATASVDGVTVERTATGDGELLLVRSDGVEVAIAERVTYD